LLSISENLMVKEGNLEFDLTLQWPEKVAVLA
jgi:hypothetical protein